MKDWRSIAASNNLDIPAQDMERIVAPLHALEDAFRPLVKELTPDLEPATGEIE